MSGTKPIVWIALAALLAVPVVPAHDQVPGPPQERPVLLLGGDLYTVSDGILVETDLLFENGRITRIEKNIEPPDDAVVLDVSGSRVYPGIIAPQSTLGLVEIGAVRATRDHAEVGAVTPEVAAHIAYNPDSELIPTVRSHGITTVQVTPLGESVRGRSFITHLDGWTKEQSQVRLIDGLNVAWPAASFRVGWWVDESREEQAESMAEQRRALRRTFETARAYARAREADEVEKLDLRWEAMRPLFGGEQPFYVTADDRRQIVEAVRFAEEFELRMVLVGGKEAYRETDLLVENDVAVIVRTASMLPMREDDDYDVAYRLPAMLHEAGVRFCMGHIVWGAWDIRNLPTQAGMAVAFGLPEEVALRSITLSTAEILGIDETLGSLEVGKEATLFVSTGDVMDSLTRDVTTMYIRGREVDLDNRHKALYRKYKQKP